MKLLLDQGLPRSAAALLTAEGLDALHAGDIGLSTADDTQIIQKGRDDGRIVVTLDADFHSILALSGSSSPSIIRIRIEGLHAREVSKLILSVVKQCRMDLESGAMISIHPDRIGIRRLPLIPDSI